MIKRGGESVRVNTKATLPLPACEVTCDSVLWKENSSSGKICRVGFFHSTGKKNVKDGSSSTTASSFASRALHEKRFCLKQTSCFSVLFKVETEKELCYPLNAALM